MSNYNKAILVLVILCLSLGSCSNIFEGSLHSELTTSLSSKEATSLLSGELDQPSDNDIHIKRQFTVRCLIDPSLIRTIKLDLVLPQLPSDVIHTFNYPRISKYNINDLMSKFFGKESSGFIFDYDSQTYIGTVNEKKAIAALLGNNLFLSYQYNMNYLYSNFLQNFNDIQMSLSEKDAILLCDKFITESGIKDYCFDFSLYYGKNDDPFYVIFYYYQLNGLACASRINDMNGKSYLTFFVGNEGIIEIRGSLYDKECFEVAESIDSTDIITPLEAINYVEKNSSEIRLGYFNPLYEKYYGKSEGLLYLPIYKMKLGYWLSDHKGCRLAWIFTIGEQDIGDKGIEFGIDAIDGSVLDDI